MPHNATRQTTQRRLADWMRCVWQMRADPRTTSTTFRIRPGHPVLDAAEVALYQGSLWRSALINSDQLDTRFTGNPAGGRGHCNWRLCALSFRDQVIAPTTNCEMPDPTGDLDFVPLRARKAKLNCNFNECFAAWAGARARCGDRVNGHE